MTFQMNDAKLNREIIASSIDRDPVGQRLTPDARERAIDFGVQTWRGNMGNGEAARIGIRHATSGVFQEDR